MKGLVFKGCDDSIKYSNVAGIVAIKGEVCYE
jgi:hypothetical protein